ncbi:hypothetical protein, partial [Mycobacteroides abscessus]|uniref:hypothetical protein n=1 Tax=Mycobacteroides abscessus TaxID=36809 RepID=UPI001A97BCEC
PAPPAENSPAAPAKPNTSRGCTANPPQLWVTVRDQYLRRRPGHTARYWLIAISETLYFKFGQ